MIELIGFWLQSIEDVLWVYCCLPLLMILGAFLTVRGRAAQIRLFPAALANFWSLLRSRPSSEGQVHPLQAFFACIGGCFGIGNLVAVCTAVQMGGPGALVWVWSTAAIGATLKYAEVYLGLRYRISDKAGSYMGGPMYYLQRVFKGTWAPALASILLCLYGVEVYQFSVITKSISLNFHWPKELIIAGLLILVLYAGRGGVGRAGKIASMTIPLFIVFYMSMSLWVIWQHSDVLPGVLLSVFSSAFTGHAAIGGFAGSSLLMALTYGMRRACYSGDLGVGYASVIHSASSEKRPEKQASLVLVDIFLENFMICTTTILLILVTGVWQTDLPQEMLVQEALATTFSYVEIFIPIFLFILGYSTINAYFVVGVNCATFLGGKLGRRIYFSYAAIALVIFAYVDTALAQMVMTLVGGILLLLNCVAIFYLRDEINYEFGEPRQEKIPAESPVLVEVEAKRGRRWWRPLAG